MQLKTKSGARGDGLEEHGLWFPAPMSDRSQVPTTQA